MTWPIAVSPLGPVEVGTLLWRRKGRIRVTAFVKATFAMIHGGFCLPVDPKPISTSERPWMDVAGATPESFIETWPELMRPEVVLHGNAIAPNREPVRALSARLVLWKGTTRLDKTVHVFGPRREQRYLPGPFSTLPLVWERTTRGANGTNPVGVKEGRPPNLVHPTRAADPACFAPRAMSWPGRQLPWTADRPFPPSTVWDWEDSLSVEAFGSAPLDQRVDVLEGDEWIVLDGMHPELPRFATRLPMPVATAWLRDESSRRETIPIVLDTMTIDATNLQVALMWRGNVPMLREDWSEYVVEADLDLQEPDRLDLPVPPAAAKTGPTSLGRGFRLKSDPPSSPSPAAAVVPAPMPPPPLVPINIPLPAPVKLGQTLSGPTPSPALASQSLGGQPLSGLPLSSQPQPPSTVTAPAHYPKNLESLEAAGSSGPQTLRNVEAPMTEGPTTEGTFSAPPTEVGAMTVPAATSASAPPADPEVTETGLRGTIVARLATKQGLGDLNLTGADLSQLDLAEASLSGLNLSGARLAGAILRRARLSNTKLAGADLTSADLSEADLTQADLSRATLIDTSFQGAQLLDANLAGCDGRRVRFDKVRAQRAIFAQGKWPESVFEGADLAGADVSGSELSQARFENAVLTGARFVDARASKLSAPHAKLSDANLAGASFIECDFTGVEGQRTVWDRAVIDGSTFQGAKLDAAGFARAHLDRARFDEASLVKASLMGVTGEGAVFDRANMEAVDLRQGKLIDCSFEGGRLCKINALKATFTNAKMMGADLTGASLRSAKLRSANLSSAILKDADLRDADLELADLRSTDKQGAKLAGASLKGAVEGD